MKKSLLIHALGILLVICGFAFLCFAKVIISHLATNSAATMTPGVMPLGILCVSACCLLGIITVVAGLSIAICDVTTVTTFDGVIKGVISNRAIVPVKSKNMPDEETTIRGANTYIEKHANGFLRVFLKGDYDEVFPLDIPEKYTEWLTTEEDEEPRLTTYSGRFKTTYRLGWLKKKGDTQFHEVYIVHTPQDILVYLDE